MERKKKARRARRRKKLLRSVILLAIVLVIAVVGGGILWQEYQERTAMKYPMEYTDLIRQYAGENDLEPAYVAAVILAESSYRTDAVSSVNAQGLMQILPSTAEWIAGKLDETYQEDSLFDPDTNIRYGCWYLGFLMNRYDHNMTCASAAYHQGQGTVDKWLADPNLSSDGKTLDKIDSAATETYVNRILKYYEKYEELYAA